MTGKTKLLIGSGDWHWDGYLTIDANPANNPDLCAVLPPLPDVVLAQQFEEIVASHVIEHFYKWDALTLLKQCYEILIPSGVLILEQPNLRYCVGVMAGTIDPPEGRSQEQFGYWGIYGSPNGNPWDGHKAGYTPETLTDLVVEAGFSADRILVGPGVWHEPIRDFLLRITK